MYVPARISLTGKWKSYDNPILNIKSDKGEYDIQQTGNDVIIRGNNLNLNWFNEGYGKIVEKAGKYFIEVFWTDTHKSQSNEKVKPHFCEIEILGNDKTVTHFILMGNTKLSFGTWEKILNQANTNNVSEAKSE